MLIYGHRGDSASAPENTPRAFELAIDAGVAGIELDVRASADAVPIVIHDRSLDRTTNSHGNVDQMMLAEIQRFDAGSDQPVPTFDDVLELVGDRVRLDIEIKQAAIEQLVLDTLARHPEVNWEISSFDWNVLRAVRRLSPSAELWPLSSAVSEEVVEIARELGSPAVAIYHAAITNETAAFFHDAGLRIIAWTVNEPEEAQRLDALGIVALVTDNPRGMRAALY